MQISFESFIDMRRTAVHELQCGIHVNVTEQDPAKNHPDRIGGFYLKLIRLTRIFSNGLLDAVTSYADEGIRDMLCGNAVTAALDGIGYRPELDVAEGDLLVMTGWTIPMRLETWLARLIETVGIMVPTASVLMIPVRWPLVVDDRVPVVFPRRDNYKQYIKEVPDTQLWYYVRLIDPPYLPVPRKACDEPVRSITLDE